MPIQSICRRDSSIGLPFLHYCFDRLFVMLFLEKVFYVGVIIKTGEGFDV